MTAEQRRVQVDRQSLRRARELPRLRSCSRVRGPQPLQSRRVAGDPVDDPKRRRSRRDRPEQCLLVTDRAQVGQAIAAAGEHHREIPDHTAQVMTRPPLLEPSQLARQRAREPRPLSDLRQQRRPRVRHKTLSVRRDSYRYPAPIARHLQGDPPESVLRASTTRRIPAQADASAAPTIGAAAAWCTIRARLRVASSVCG
jgi:hypothetical protein